MRIIRFSHIYNKMWGQVSGELLAVKEITIDKDTSSDLLEYDTRTTDGDTFHLKPGKYLQLVFLGNKGIPFCTIRPAYPPEKVTYYKRCIGELFEIIINFDTAKNNHP